MLFVLSLFASLFLVISLLQPKKKQIFSFHLKETREKNEAFGSSLLLANSPMSPKIVNGSFAAIFDADEFLAKAYAGIRIAVSFLFVCFFAVIN